MPLIPMVATAGSRLCMEALKWYATPMVYSL